MIGASNCFKEDFYSPIELCRIFNLEIHFNLWVGDLSLKMRWIDYKEYEINEVAPKNFHVYSYSAL